MPVDDENPSVTEVANGLYTALLSGADFTVPVTDVSGPAYAPPSAAENPLYASVSSLTEDMLTSREMGGSGLFDGLMESMGKHLKSEYEKGRITGKEYAEVWSASMGAALGNAVQFLLQKDNAFYQANLIKMQARAAEIQAVTEKVQLELVKTQLATARIDALTSSMNYAAAKMGLAIQSVNYDTAKGELKQIDFNVGMILPKQAEQIGLQNDKMSFEIDYLLPKELEKSVKQIEVMSSEISGTTAKTNQVLYETASLLPAQRSKIDAETAISVYQLSDRLPAEVASLAADTAGKIYNNTWLLPAQLDSIREQTEGHRSRTLNTRTDGAPIAGSVGVQNRLQEEQISSFKRDAETKVVKMLLDTWITQKSVDEGLPAPASLTDTNLNSAVTGLRTKVGL